MSCYSGKTVSVLGSTGSVGTQTLDVARSLGAKVKLLTGSQNVALMEDQIREFRPSVCVMNDASAAADLKSRVADTSCRVLSGADEIVENVAVVESDVVVNAITGIAGLRPSVAAINAGKDLALANKETIVTAGKIVTGLAAEKNVKILPVDSEHSAIFQCLNGKKPAKIYMIWSGRTAIVYKAKNGNGKEKVWRDR